MHGGSDQPAPPAAEYIARSNRFQAEAAECTSRFNRVANVRLVAFVASAACLIWGLVQGAPVAVGGGLVFGATFVVLVRYHRLIGLRRDRTSALHEINAEALARLDRRWPDVPVRHTVQADRLHPYAADLDLFGQTSLLHLIDTTRTSMGQAKLARWLLDGPTAPTIWARQQSVSELAPRLDLRQELEVRGALDGATRLDPEPLLTWAESNPWLVRRGGLIWASRLSPLLLCALGLAQLTGVLPWPLWLPLLFVNAVLWQLVGQQAYATLSRISATKLACGSTQPSSTCLQRPHSTRYC